MKRRKRDFQLYTGMWLVAIFVLLALMWQNAGDARVINYSGIVRGATQKLVKEELNGHSDDKLIETLDGIIDNLQTGKGPYRLMKNSNEKYQRLLAELKLVWEDMKKEIVHLNSGSGSEKRLYDLSQRHFEMADRMVFSAEESSDNKLKCFLIFYIFSLLLSITVFFIVNRRNQKALDESIYTDSLTGLLSRTGFEVAAGKLLSRNLENKYTIVEFDIKNFKSINDSYGYDKGDKLLHSVAAAISARRSGRICARIDADEFVILFEQGDIDVDELKMMLRDVVRKHTFLELFGAIFNYGAYRIERNGELINTIMDKANTAHKIAKSIEGEAFVWYDERLLKKIQMENEYKKRMQYALEMEEFKMYLQPKIDLATMEVAGAEALVRWDIPEVGIIPPDSYIPLFEKNGSIADLDFYMLKKACAYLRGQLDRGNEFFSISVNFSRVTLCQQTFHSTLLEIINRFGVPSRRIEIEVTESAFNELPYPVLLMLERLKDEGFRISMDDFGAGYSNLNMIGKLPIQIIKLDREFLKEMDGHENMRGIVICAVDLAHTMGLEIICEGVEREEHVHFLQDIGCDYAQGFYFSKPIPGEAFTEKYLTGEMRVPLNNS